MELEAVLKKILEKFDNDYRKNSRIRALEKTISEGADHYKYAEEMAREVGAILNGALRVYLPEALTDGMLYRKAADVVLKQPMLKAVKPVSDAASSVQKNINTQAGIGIKPIIPEVNEDQVNGIITGICNAESYESGKETLFDQVENFLEGHVDDSVHDNAGFQYEAGLDPTVTRTAAAKCCKWCDQLAGTYDYEKIRNKGNDVWRRHKNCHCIIDYRPGYGTKESNGRRNANARRYTDDDRSDRIDFGKRSAKNSFQSSADPMREVFGSGEQSHPKEIAAFRREAAQAGVQIIEREYESLAYSPGLASGQPGTLYISKGASFSGWSHEIQHMRDDQTAGWSGMRILSNPEECYQREKNAYEIEIKMAEEAGRKDIASRLRENLEAERRRIYGIN